MIKAHKPLRAKLSPFLTEHDWMASFLLLSAIDKCLSQEHRDEYMMDVGTV